ncbi:hypothetical protein LJB85_00475 [Porphyromonadaceae bacterium OttesenSCG-928-L07]|nr:hypothetical protein [Porphyromonadaceae bacterium OttesenSCG-928-L07]
MKNKYNDFIRNFKQVLNRFRFGLLFYDVLKGCILLSGFTLLYLLLYYIFISYSPLTVSFKTALFFVFVLINSLLFIWFVIRYLILFIRSGNFKNNFLLKRIQAFPEIVNDVFISLYHLAFHRDEIPGDEQLKKAAFIQKYVTLKNERKLLLFPKKKLLREGLILLGIVVVFFVNSGFFSGLYRDLIHYEDVSNPKFNIEFTLLNQTLDVENGKPFQLQLKVYSEYTDIENVFLAFGGGEFLMNKKDSLYTYDFDVINNDLRFNFIANGIESRLYKITVLPTPEITDYQVTNIPPSYSGLKAETFKNTVDFRVLYGSSLRFSVHFSDVDTLFLKSGEKISEIAMKSKSNADFVRRVTGSGEVVLLGSNKHFSKKELIHFNVTSMPDLYPGIQVSELQDSLDNAQRYFYGIITDDFGFSDLRFVFSLNGRTNTVMPINISKNLNTQEFFFEFNFGEFAGMDKTEIKYYFEVFDNDEISGPKSTRSDAGNYQIPDLNAIFEYNTESNANINASLNEAEKLAKEIVAGVRDLQKKILENASDDWEKQQLAKDIVEKKEKLDKLLKEVKEQNLQKSALNNNFTKQDSLLMEKQKLMQELLDKVMDDEMKKLMDEFQKLADEFSKDKFKDLDGKMKLEFDQLSEVLDRNIELLKSMQVEEQHNMISQQLQQLRDKQDEFRKALEDKNISSDSLSQMSEDLKEEMNHIQENYDALRKENEELSKPFELNSFQEKFDKLSEDLNKQHENSQGGKDDKELSDDIQEQLDELTEEMEQQKQENFMDMSLPQNDIELIVQNILLVSFSQEEIMNAFKGASPQSAAYREWSAMQELKRREYKIIKDSLSALSRSNMMLASLLSDKFFVIETKFDLLPDYIQNNNKNELLKEQQYIITYLNDMVLILMDALQQGKGDEGEEGEEGEGGQSGKSGNKKGGKKKNNDSGQPYDNLKDAQKRMKNNLEKMLDQIKSGEKGKPLHQNISKMIRENELFKKSLEDFMMKGDAMSDVERQMLNEINRLLDENIRDISNYSFGRNIMERNNQIFNKLLMSEKASKEREEYEEKRKSVTADDTKYKRPELMFNLKEKNALIKSDLQKSGVILNPYYKNLYNNYFIKLSDE